MVQPLKTRGLQDLLRLLNRVTRLYAMRRIGEEDFRYIEKRLKEVEARIVEMRERGIPEMEEF